MKIFMSGSLVDFEAPAYMNETQLGKFIKEMKTIFESQIAVKQIVETRKEMGDIERKPRRFSEKDQLSLADSTISNEDLARQLGKTEFAIQMKRGPFLMQLQDWARKKGKTKIGPKDVEEFIRETR